METALPCEVPESDVVGPHWVHGVGYQALPGKTDIVAALRERSFEVDRATFVDLGAGKGRALLLAAQAAFRSIVGVEYSASLVTVARANVARTGDGRIRVEHGDAAAYAFPDGNLVLYLFNPFDATVMQHVVRNLARAYERQPRRIVLLYYLPQADCLQLWDNVPFLRFAGMRDGAAVYDMDDQRTRRPRRS